MTRSRQALRFNKPTDVSGLAINPYNGLTSDIIEQIGELSNTGNLGIVYYFDHFFFANGRFPAAEGTTGQWTLSGTTGAATVTFPNTRNGEIVLTGDATGSVNPTLQLGSATAPAPFIYAVGKRMWCFARLKLVTVATTEAFFGFATPDTSPTTTGTFPSDGIFFEKASTATKFNFQARKDGTATTKSTIGNTLVDDTYITIGFVVDIKGNILPFQNGSLVAAGVIPAGTANIPVTADVMQPIIGILGASMTMTIDWVLFAQDV